MSVRIGLGIGRLMFAALNRFELLLLLVVVAALVAGRARSPCWWRRRRRRRRRCSPCSSVVRPVLSRRSDRVLAGEDLPRSRAHLCYVALKLSKVLALVVLGVTALATVPA